LDNATLLPTEDSVAPPFLVASASAFHSRPYGCWGAALQQLLDLLAARDASAKAETEDALKQHHDAEKAKERLKAAAALAQQAGVGAANGNAQVRPGDSAFGLTSDGRGRRLFSSTTPPSFRRPVFFLSNLRHMPYGKTLACKKVVEEALVLPQTSM
jgi:hypothetical protein